MPNRIMTLPDITVQNEERGGVLNVFLYGPPLGPFWAILGPFAVKMIDYSGRPKRGSQEAPGPLLGPCWAILGPSLGPCGPSKAPQRAPHNSGNRARRRPHISFMRRPRRCICLHFYCII